MERPGARQAVIPFGDLAKKYGEERPVNFSVAETSVRL